MSTGREHGAETTAGGAGGDTCNATGNVLHAAMRKAASTVAVVTARGESQTRGVTVSSLTALSLNPALISFALRRHSRMGAVLGTAGRFHVHILGDGQAPLARRFAAPGLSGPEQFAGLAPGPGEAGEPRLPGALAALTCAPHSSLEAGTTSSCSGG